MREVTLAAVRRVARQFAWADPVIGVRLFGHGHINETFLVSTSSREYVVQRVNRAVFADPEAVIGNIVTVTDHLAGRSTRELVPQLVPAARGGYLVRDGDDVWRVWQRVAGAHNIDAPTPDRVAAAARLLGRFHAELADLDPALVTETLPHFHDPRRRLERLREGVAADPHGRVGGVADEIAAAFAAEPLVTVAADLVARVPRRVAHNDAKLDNVLFRRGEAVCLVDLDTLMPSAWFWDVGDLLRTASTVAAEDEAEPGRAVVDPELFAATIGGYRAGLATGGSMTPAEDEALSLAGAIVTYEQALRFLTDWIAGDVYYRTTRPGQNLDRARAQLGLLASMPGTVGS